MKQGQRVSLGRVSKGTSLVPEGNVPPMSVYRAKDFRIHK